MTEEQKKRCKLLKEKNRTIIKKNLLKSDVLFQECMRSLKNCRILSLEEQTEIFKKFEKKFPITISGSIDWKSFNGIVERINVSSIYERLDLKNKYYILWDRQELPCLLSDLSSILKHIDDVLAVSFDTWIFSLDEKEVIEFYHEGDIIYGKVL